MEQNDDNASNIAYVLLQEHTMYLQKQIDEAHAVLNKLKAPTNGEEGIGKRQSLSLAQRIERLKK